jgi:hypothetical protein
MIEKNLDGRLLSPQTLVQAAAGHPLEVVRSNRKTGRVERLPGTLLSTADGVVFQTAQGVEALRCSGLPETFTFTSAGGLSAAPTLSVRLRANHSFTTLVTLSYLAHGFDWSADYTATLSADGRRMDLGAWVTLANGNGVSFPSAHTQVVAGRLNRETDEVEPIDAGGPVLASCWPQGSTSDPPEYLRMRRFFKRAVADTVFPAAASDLIEQVVVTGARRVQQEQLGDLKLYRVPERTTVASRQAKQVRLLDRLGIPVHTVYTAEVNEEAPAESGPVPANVLLRTRNDEAHHLGLPLPSGRVGVFAPHQGQRLLIRETDVRDLAVNEEVEIGMGNSADVEVKSTTDEVSLVHERRIPLVPGVLAIRESDLDSALRVQVSNARASKIEFELVLQLGPDTQVVRADHPIGKKNGRPVFRFVVPPNGTATVRFQTARTSVHVTR